MNNKKLGTDFEKRIVDRLTKLGFWVHFLNPDSRGAQPFDIIAIKKNRIFAIDCKTCKANSITLDRLEDNQKFAFDVIAKKTTAETLVVVEHDDYVFVIPYDELKEAGKVKLACNHHELERMLNQ